MGRAVAVAAMACLLPAGPAAGQDGRRTSGELPKSFAAVTEIRLDPPLPGTEKAHQELVAALERDMPRFPEGRPYARCTLRGDLPEPLPFGLVCRDETGTYIGAVRGKNIRTVRAKLNACSLGNLQNWASPGTMPLFEYRYVFLEHIGDKAEDHVANLIRADGFWQVVASRDMVPTAEADRSLAMHAAVFTPGGDHWGFKPPRRARLELRDTSGRRVRDICCGESRRDNEALNRVVRLLVNARKLDEEVHQMVPTLGRR